LIEAAAALLKLNKLDEARLQAEAAGERLPDGANQAMVHELLARIALARRDAEGARHEAELAVQADPNLPMTAFVEARLLYDHGRFAEALPLFEQALAALRKNSAALIEDLSFYAGDTLSRLERFSEAEFEFDEQLRAVPQHARANAGLAMVYLKTGRTDEAEQTAVDMTRLSPTPDAYGLAAKVWTALGKPRQADALRLEARKTFGRPKR